jgi:hypothetical protein
LATDPQKTVGIMGGSQLLVATGDFTSAMDVIDDLRKAMHSGELRGLHCFRHLPEQVDAAAAECDRILTGEFLRQVRRSPVPFAHT